MAQDNPKHMLQEQPVTPLTTWNYRPKKEKNLSRFISDMHTSD